mgnify:CR=1 FL=1
MSKKTVWFPDVINPVRIGIYQIQCFGRRLSYSYWNGETWGFRCDNFYDAFNHRHKKSMGNIIKWRGLAKKQ